MHTSAFPSSFNIYFFAEANGFKRVVDIITFPFYKCSEDTDLFRLAVWQRYEGEIELLSQLYLKFAAISALNAEKSS